MVSLVDEHGSSVISYGRLDNGTDQDVDGDTVFEMGSVTKTFTALLLQDAIERGEMKLEDPVASTCRGQSSCQPLTAKNSRYSIWPRKAPGSRTIQTTTMRKSRITPMRIIRCRRCTNICRVTN